MEIEQPKITDTNVSTENPSSFRSILIAEVVISFIILVSVFSVFTGGDAVLFFFAGYIEKLVLILAPTLLILDIVGFLKSQKEIKKSHVNNLQISSEVHRLKIFSILSFLFLILLTSWVFYKIEKSKIDEANRVADYNLTFDTYFKDNSVHEVENIDGDLHQTTVWLKEKDKNGDREYVYLYSHNNSYEFGLKGLNNFEVRNLVLKIKIQELSQKIIGQKIVIKNALLGELNDRTAEVYFEGKSLIDDLIPSVNETQENKLIRLNKEYDSISKIFEKPFIISGAFRNNVYPDSESTEMISVYDESTPNISLNLSIFPKNTDVKITDTVTKFVEDNFTCQWCGHKKVSISIPSREDYIKNNGYTNNSDFLIKVKELEQFYK
jgi:hypothetical protein